MLTPAGASGEARLADGEGGGRSLGGETWEDGQVCELPTTAGVF